MLLNVLRMLGCNCQYTIIFSLTSFVMNDFIKKPTVHTQAAADLSGRDYRALVVVTKQACRRDHDHTATSIITDV